MQSPMANNQANVSNTNSIIMLRDYRKGNWTVQETMVLIEAKKMDEERRTKRSSESASKAAGGGGELRWKWVEDYCWRHGCLRSQNQCNDKWDNLMRDFKRVRDHQRRVLLLSEPTEAEPSSGYHQSKSYWETDRVERKDRNLPSNMLAQVYDALLDVVDRRSGGFRSTSNADNMAHAQAHAQVVLQTQAVLLQPLSNVMAAPAVVPPLLSLPPTQAVGPSPMEAVEKHQCHRPLPTVDYDTSEHSDSLPSKRRKKGGERGGEGASTSTTNIGSEISKSACLIAEAIHACDEREDARHKDLLNLHQKRLQIEESKAEVTKQGFNGLVDAINKLANSILALANSNKNH